VAALRQSFLGESSRRGGIAGHSELRPRHQGGTPYVRSRSRHIEAQEGIQPLAALGEGAPDEPPRTDRDADPQADFRVVMSQAPGQDLGYVLSVDDVAARTVNPIRPRDGYLGHPDGQILLRGQQ
jgi:hypothetical protein